MENRQPALTINHLKVVLRSNQTPLLHNISFSLYPGEVFALVGESGSGKSITSLAIMRLLPDALQIHQGQVYTPDDDLFRLTEQQMSHVRGKKIAMIFQEPMSSLNPVQTIGEQIAESLALHTALSRREIQERIDGLLEEVGIPDPTIRKHWYPYQLSGGQQQRVMIAMALACEPDILLADEPTTALDVTIQKQILQLIRDLTKERQLAVLLITHDMGVVKQSADHVGVMHEGKLIETNPCDEFFNNPQHPYSQHLINSLPPRKFLEQQQTEPLLRVDNLAVHFPIRKGVFQQISDYTRAVNDVSFTIPKGQTLALVGESGCGKTTVGRAILNLEKNTAGTIYFNQQRLDTLNRRSMLPYRKNIQVIFQNPFSSMNPRMTVGEIIEEGMISLAMPLSEKQRQERIEQLLLQVQLLPEHRTRYPHEFSGGQRQRIAIARALAVEPELIICDEPTSALDVSTRAELLALLQQLQTELGVAYLFITHDLSIIPMLAHNIAVMEKGRIVEQGNTEQVLESPKHPYTRSLLSAVPFDIMGHYYAVFRHHHSGSDTLGVSVCR